MDDPSDTRRVAVAQYLAAARAAAPTFGLVPERVDMLSLSENVVCKLTLAEGGRVAMRLHRPGYNTRAELESEVEWVMALGAAGVPVPTARPTIDGDYYTTVTLKGGEVNGQTLDVGVVEWVEGDPIRNMDDLGDTLVGHYRQIGALSAQIRQHFNSWTPPAGFTRRSWNVEAFLGDSPAWGRFWDVEALTPAQRSLFAKARSALTTELTDMPTGPSHFGLIHADLHLGNLMTDGHALTVIDFDDAGFGWFGYELAVALHPMLEDPAYDDARRALLESYRSVHPLAPDEEQSIDTFLTLRSLIDVSWLDARKDLPTYRNLPKLISNAERVAVRYLDASL